MKFFVARPNMVVLREMVSPTTLESTSLGISTVQFFRPGDLKSRMLSLREFASDTSYRRVWNTSLEAKISLVPAVAFVAAAVRRYSLEAKFTLSRVTAMTFLHEHSVVHVGLIPCFF